MLSQIVNFKPWLLNFDHKFDGQEEEKEEEEETTTRREEKN